MTATRTPTIKQEQGVTVITLGPDYESLDENDLDDVKEVLLRVASSADPPLVVLDLPRTKFFGSAFIELLFRAWNRLNSRAGGRFAISGLTDYCKEVIEITHLDQLWDVYETSRDAVRVMSSK
jgi:anti-anti-sigma factor